MRSPELRDLTTLDDLSGVAALEKRIWGLTGGDDVTPVALLAATVKRGAILVGAFDPGTGPTMGEGALVGFVELAHVDSSGRSFFHLSNAEHDDPTTAICHRSNIFREVGLW